jgi:hypothetical protein
MRHAFTLIEALIAIALGTIVSGMLFAGIRLAASCVTTADRLAVQNQLITSAMLQLSDELDSWEAFDDPADPAKQPFRTGLDGAGRGMPFCKFSDVWPASGIVNAWGDDPATWSPAEPASWWRGCMAERCEGDFRNRQPRFGWYGISGASVPSGVTPTYGGYGAPPQPTSDSSEWAYDQQKGLYHALGFYVMADYLPANAIFAWYEDTAIPPQPNPWPTTSGIPCYFLIGGSSWPAQAYNRNAGATPTPQSVYQATYNGIFALVPRVAATPTVGLDEIINRNRYAWTTWEAWFNLDGLSQMDFLRKEVADLMSRCEARSEITPIRPAHWPSVTARVVRTLHKAYFTNLCTIAWISPQTGETSELRYSGFGTTLRGARIQRGLDAP